jgi:hypothetical protein
MAIFCYKKVDSFRVIVLPILVYVKTYGIICSHVNELVYHNFPETAAIVLVEINTFDFFPMPDQLLDEHI